MAWKCTGWGRDQWTLVAANRTCRCEGQRRPSITGSVDRHWQGGFKASVQWGLGAEEGEVFARGRRWIRAWDYDTESMPEPHVFATQEDAQRKVDEHIRRFMQAERCAGGGAPLGGRRRRR